MTSGYDKPLYILPFDHRHSFVTGVFHWQEPLAPEQVAEIVASKQVIYDGFKAAVDEGIPHNRAGILVDEEFGAAILRDAQTRGYVTCVSTEKSGQDEFDFEYGDAFAHHIEEVNPTFAKVLVRYNPDGDSRMNARQVERLRRLSDYLARTKRLFMFELLVPAEQAQLDRLGSRAAYDRELRPTLVIGTIRALQDAGVEPDVWKIEGLDRREDCEKTVDTARRDGRDGRLHRPRARVGRASGVALAQRSGGCPWLHRFRGRPDDMAGGRDGVAPRRNHEGDRGGSNRWTLP